MLYYILVGCVILLLYLYRTFKLHSHWKNVGVPQYSVLTTWYYQLTNFVRFKSISEEIEDNYKDFPNVRYYGLYNFTKPILMLKDPVIIKNVMVKDFDHFTDHFKFIESPEQAVWNKNLFNLDGEKWRHMRNKLSPFFTGSKMKLMFGLVSDSAQQLVQHFQNQKLDEIHVEMRDVFTRFANDVIATTAFGITCDSMKYPDNEFYKMGKIVTSFGDGVIDMMKFSFVLLFPKFSRLLGMEVFNGKAVKFFEDIINQNISQRRENGIVRPDMIHLLLASNKNESDENAILKDDDIAAQAFIFFLAGFDSIATLMHFMAYEIAVHPEVQKQLHEEVDGFSTNLTYEDLPKLKYLDQVILETNRKWPVALILDRVCVKPYTIEPTEENEKPLQINVGDSLMIPLPGLHRDPNYFPNPHSFDPSRFDDDNNKTIANSFMYLPFGNGPRGCVGVRFAMMEVKLIYFYLLSNFEFTVIEKTPIPLKLSKTKFQLTCDDGFWIGLKQRKFKSQ